MTVHWFHVSGAADANGVVSYGTNNAEGTHVADWGGYAAPLTSANASSTNTDGTDANGTTPYVGSTPTYDSGTDTTRRVLGFAAPPGLSLRVHIWWTIEGEA